ncbi:hypothetical protein [Pseudochrobactrum sp. MP213Fo]
MAITTLEPFTLNPHDELSAEIVDLIDAAATYEEPVNPVNLTEA